MEDKELARSLRNLKESVGALKESPEEEGLGEVNEKLEKLSGILKEQKNKGKKIQTFNTENNTDDWAVCVDGYFGLFRSRQEAERVYDMVGGGGGPVGDELAETPFGAADILPPGYKPKLIDWPDEPDKISDFEPINIEKYIEDEWRK